MLKLRVQIPDIGKEYDVQCNEKAYVEDVIQDILDLICLAGMLAVSAVFLIRSSLQRKRRAQVEKEEKLAVYSVQKGSFLKKSRTLEEHRVQSGENIMIL